MSIDGYIDDASPERLLLSNAADFDRVDGLRAASDAILIGARTLRTDNPRLLVNDADRRAARVARGEPEYPVKVTVTESGELDPTLRFWHTGGKKLVYTGARGAAELRMRFGGDFAEVEIVALTDLSLAAVLDDLGARGIRELMVEGGTGIHTGFLSAGLADELKLAIAPILVGDSAAPRFVDNSDFPGGPQHRMELKGVDKLGDIAVLNYRVSDRQHPKSSPIDS
ncbi:hypothetical protein GCM10011591_28240 [Nocardia camponoti]|uniref:Bacterial bifunctional deaminase-reductase C-terminal domain-containing protein n=2 Tax=Nocardia camponoti TaxID=1616106 RepID=A0A917QKD1_9NOCA|nr:hypothetical protein GCM10011591_28240 [Nocardia camponoti]